MSLHNTEPIIPTPTIRGDWHTDELTRVLYATDASMYRELPLAVAYPRDAEDLATLIAYARTEGLSLIPRAGGTSLAGQCVGSGIVVDVSRHLNQILDFDPEQGRVWVQPGLIRDELNRFLKPYGWHFGPNTSTSNRCTLGGMVGNNSCGSGSIVYGSTRDHVLRIRALLSDGSEVCFEPLSADALSQKCTQSDLEGQLYRQLLGTLEPPERQELIRRQYPKAGIHRRNTGYALDVLLDRQPFREGGAEFSLVPLLCGSEGTLAFSTAIELSLSPLPPPQELLLCVHFAQLDEALRAVVPAMEHPLWACELMDKLLLDCTRENREQRQNRFFLQGDPAAVLLLECRGHTPAEAEAVADAVEHSLRQAGLGYAFPRVHPPNMQKVWALRKAGLGVLSSMKGPGQPITFVEDTAVALPDLVAYIRDFGAMLAGFGKQAVHHAHAGAGELHLRPVLDLRNPQERQQLVAIAEASARLVKQYRGSLSGEHGDGRVRSPLLPLVLGEEVCSLLAGLKQTWDPAGIFNPGKIVSPSPIDQSLRADMPLPTAPAAYAIVARCNGSGDCRKPGTAGGTMCPSYMATGEERDSTRGRANALRDYWERPPEQRRYDARALKPLLDRCLSCKGCATECPSSVDLSAARVEFLDEYRQAQGLPLRDYLFAWLPVWMPILSAISPLLGPLFQAAARLKAPRRWLGLAEGRPLPLPRGRSLRHWYRRHYRSTPGARGIVALYADEFTNYLDVELGKDAIALLQSLGYEVLLPELGPSGRSYLSKGFLAPARRAARANVEALSQLAGRGIPLVGLEPSAISCFHDEYPGLLEGEERERAQAWSGQVWLIEEFLYQEAQAGRIEAGQFRGPAREVWVHGHCHQKALRGQEATAWLLSLPGHTVRVLPTGCCGLAGSFGYEAAQEALSWQIAETRLFPELRKAPGQVLIAANGHSCRQQIMDGLGIQALHPIQVL